MFICATTSAGGLAAPAARGRLAAGTLEAAEVDGYPALILRRGGAADTVLAARIDDGLVTGIYAVRNPAKLSRLDEARTLCRRLTPRAPPRPG